ncbi:hypothetical protein D041_0639B, partial [Vibrio parahaemolyticus EKP-008]
SRIFSPAFV